MRRHIHTHEWRKPPVQAKKGKRGGGKKDQQRSRRSQFHRGSNQLRWLKEKWGYAAKAKGPTPRGNVSNKYWQQLGMSKGRRQVSERSSLPGLQAT